MNSAFLFNFHTSTLRMHHQRSLLQGYFFGMATCLRKAVLCFSSGRSFECLLSQAGTCAQRSFKRVGRPSNKSWNGMLRVIPYTCAIVKQQPHCGSINAFTNVRAKDVISLNHQLVKSAWFSCSRETGWKLGTHLLYAEMWWPAVIRPGRFFGGGRSNTPSGLKGYHC